MAGYGIKVTFTCKFSIFSIFLGLELSLFLLVGGVEVEPFSKPSSCSAPLVMSETTEISDNIVNQDEKAGSRWQGGAKLLIGAKLGARIHFKSDKNKMRGKGAKGSFGKLTKFLVP